MGLQASDLCLGMLGIDLDPIVGRQDARGERAGDDGPESSDREHAIDRQAWQLVGASLRHRCGKRAERGTELVEPRPVFEDTGTIGAPSRNVPRTAPAHVFSNQLEPVGLDQIGLGQRDQSGFDPQQRADRQVLARLRHHALVGRDDQHRQVDSADAGQHVPDEALVARHVDDLDREARLLEKREAEIDRDAPSLLLGEAIRIGPGEGLHQRGLAVVDVAGRADDDVRRGRRAHRRAAALVSASARRPT